MKNSFFQRNKKPKKNPEKSPQAASIWLRHSYTRQRPIKLSRGTSRELLGHIKKGLSVQPERGIRHPAGTSKKKPLNNTRPGLWYVPAFGFKVQGSARSQGSAPQGGHKFLLFFLIIFENLKNRQYISICIPIRKIDFNYPAFTFDCLCSNL
jgi:hypothetical protein